MAAAWLARPDRANRFPDAAKEKPLARWAEARRVCCLRPQGGALGWENGGLSARRPQRGVILSEAKNLA